MAELTTKLENSSIASPKTQGNNNNPVSPTKNEDLYQVSDRVWLILTEKLGSGGFSEVFKGYKENKSCKVAIKRIKQSEADDPKSKELDILQSTRHDNLVLYYFTERTSDYLYYVLELANYSLDGWIKLGNHDNDTLTKVCKDVATGLKALHKKRIIHRDIKPQNVLIFIKEETGKLVPTGKLADFGISRILNEDEEAALTTKGHVGTQTYLPPEAPEAEEKMELKLSFDIFPLGILFGFAMTGGQHMFSWPGQTAYFEIKTKIKNNEPNWSLLDEKKFTALKNLLQVMLSTDPNKRGTISELLDHPFFWTEEEGYQFLVKVSKEIKNEKACNTAVTFAAQKFLSDLPDWKVRLDDKIQEWIKEKDMELMELEKSKTHKPNALNDNWRKYNGRSIIQLINFIRDQDEHYINWLSSELEDERIFGNKQLPKYRSYFMRTFPELPTLLYNVLQDQKFQRRETAMFYKHNLNSLFELKSK